MPLVTILITREGTSPERNSATATEKAMLIKGVSNLLLTVLNKPIETTHVVIEEVDLDNWGRGGLPTAEFRRAQALATETWF